VPIASGGLGGLDALLATVQMPPGVPVATVAIGGARNAAILAVQILGTADAGLRDHMLAFKKMMAEQAAAKDAKMQEALKLG
jgi:phosphoribosylaminoimidazole carboxylase PurE protein